MGPDGIVDAQISLSGLASGKTVSAVNVSSPNGAAWAYGLNPQSANNAELVLNSADATLGTLSISPLANTDLAGTVLTVNVVYSDYSTDVTTVIASAVNTQFEVPPPSPIVIDSNTISVTWLGQDGYNLGGTGAVHLSVANIPAGRTVVAGMLNDSANLSWAFGSVGGVLLTKIDPLAKPLTFQSTGNGTSADIGFKPDRDETGATLTLRLILDDGSSLVTSFAGGFSDPGLQYPAPAATTFHAKPGDNIHAIVNNYGTVYLAAGTYNLYDPLILNRPVTIIGQPGAVLLFTQPANSYAWTTAIKVHASNTTLQGFAVRFSGPVEWAPDITYGPAVIGATDNYDFGFTDRLYNLTFTNLDLQSPPATSSNWEEAIRLIRLAGAQSGEISQNTLKGGAIEFFHGPWLISENHYVGTMPNTFSYGLVVGHYVNDVQIINNTIDGGAADSKTWRFTILTQAGVNVVVSGNVISNIGPRDNDILLNPNAPETILTESYRLHFEGAPSAISADGLVVQIPYVQRDFVRTGDIVAILTGPDAGQWRLVRQALSATAFLLDRPIDPSTSVVSIASGFANMLFSGNKIDSRGSSRVDSIALVGNVYGTTVTGNQIIGGKDALWVDAAPTEMPNIWGWSHAPVMGLVVTNNIFQDTIDGGVINVEHGNSMKTNIGRLYFTGTISGNLVIWTQAFLDSQAASHSTPEAFSIGNFLSIDPREMELTLSDNVFVAPANLSLIPSFLVTSGTINGTPIMSQVIALQGGASAIRNLRLVNDDGSSATDKETSDGRITFEPLSPLLSYEYSLTGLDGSYLPITDLGESGFLPAGLAQGNNTVYVRAAHAFGVVGEPSSLSYALFASLAAPDALRLVNDTGSNTSDSLTNDATLTFSPVSGADRYEYSLTGLDGSYQPIVFLSGTYFRPAGLVEGTNTVYVRAVNAAGDAGPSRSISFVLDSNTPADPVGLRLLNDTGIGANDGITSDVRVTFSEILGTGRYEYSVNGAAGSYLPVIVRPDASFLPMGLTQGSNSLYVRAVDDAGNASASSLINFILDTTPPSNLGGLRLLNDTGSSAYDGITNDVRVTLWPASEAAYYEYTVVGAFNSYLPVVFLSGTTFLPMGLTQGNNLLFVRAVDAAGNTGGVTSLSFWFDTTPPPAIRVVSVKPNGLVTIASAEAGATYEYRLSTWTGYVQVGTSTTFTVHTGSRRATTAYIRAVDKAGNTGPDTRFILPASTSAAFGKLRRFFASGATRSLSRAWR